MPAVGGEHDRRKRDRQRRSRAAPRGCARAATTPGQPAAGGAKSASDDSRPPHSLRSECMACPPRGATDAPSRSRRRRCARESWDFEKLGVRPSAKPMSACVKPSTSCSQTTARVRAGSVISARSSAASSGAEWSAPCAGSRSAPPGSLSSHSSPRCQGERRYMSARLTAMARIQDGSGQRPSYAPMCSSTSTKVSCSSSSAMAGRRTSRRSKRVDGTRGRGIDGFQGRDVAGAGGGHPVRPAGSISEMRVIARLDARGPEKVAGNENSSLVPGAGVVQEAVDALPAARPTYAHAHRIAKLPAPCGESPCAQPSNQCQLSPWQPAQAVVGTTPSRQSGPRVRRPR